MRERPAWQRPAAAVHLPGGIPPAREPARRGGQCRCGQPAPRCSPIWSPIVADLRCGSGAYEPTGTRAEQASGMITVKLGDVIEAGDRDYKYGTGPLILRVTRIGGRQRTADGEWLDLDGLELRSDGSQVGSQPRHADVRVTAMRVWRGPRPDR